MRNYYLKNRSDKAKQQEQINNVLRVYDFIGQANRKKPLPTAPKRGEPDVRTRKTNLPKG